MNTSRSRRTASKCTSPPTNQSVTLSPHYSYLIHLHTYNFGNKFDVRNIYIFPLNIENLCTLLIQMFTSHLKRSATTKLLSLTTANIHSLLHPPCAVFLPCGVSSPPPTAFHKTHVKSPSVYHLYNCTSKWREIRSITPDGTMHCQMEGWNVSLNIIHLLNTAGIQGYRNNALHLHIAFLTVNRLYFLLHFYSSRIHAFSMAQQI